MQIVTYSEVKKIAAKKWKEYLTAFKKTGQPIYKDLAAVYNQIKGGRKIIDIGKTISKAGLHPKTNHPRLAIAQAVSKKVFCTLHQSGSVSFSNKSGRWGSPEVLRDDVLCSGAYEQQDWLKGNPYYSRINLSAPVPMIPPQFYPPKMTKDYYVLWEVDVWKMEPPTDPYLLKRITNNLFVVLAGWDLTPLEKAVMKGRLI